MAYKYRHCDHCLLPGQSHWPGVSMALLLPTGSVLCLAAFPHPHVPHIFPDPFL